MTNLKKLKPFINKKDYSKFLFYLILAGFSVLLELFSIALIFPIVSLIIDINFLSNYKTLIEILYFISPLKFINADQHFNSIIGLLVVFFFSFVLKNIFILYINFFRANFVYSILTGLKKQTFLKVTQISFNEFIKFKSSDIVTFISQLSAIVSIFENLLMIILEGLLIISIIIFLLFFDTATSFSFVSLIIFLSIVLIYFIKNKTYSYGEQRRAAEADLLFVSNNIIYGIKEIKLSGLISYFIDAFDKTSKKAQKASRNFSFISSIPRSYLEIVIALGIVLFFTINLINSPDKIDLTIVSSSAVFLAAGLRIMPSMGKVVNSYNSYKYYLPTLKKINEFVYFLDSIKQENSKSIKFNSSIRFDEIKFSYDQNNLIFHNCNFEIKSGDKIGLYGQSGSGKTTFINLISGLTKPQKGSVYINGKKEINYIVSNLSLVSQMPFFINSSIRDNLTFSFTEKTKNDEKIFDILDKLDLKYLIESTDGGLNSPLGERGAKFSGGQLQRLNIARALLNNPEILILDEATNALDKVTELKVLNYILKLLNNKTVIIISHDKAVLKKCDQTYGIKNNKLEKLDFRNL